MSKYLVASMRHETFTQIAHFCRSVYIRLHGPVEGERLYKSLTFKDAMALWHAGLPDSASVC